MSSFESLLLLAVNAFAFVLSTSVLLLALWQRTLWHSSLWRSAGMPGGNLLSVFLMIQALLNLSVVGLYFNRIFLGASPILEDGFSKLSISAFALTVLSAFWLIVAATGLMKHAFLVISRAGLVGFIILVWPLWNGRFFQSGDEVVMYAPAGVLAAMVTVIFIGLALAVAWTYRHQIRPSALLFSLTVLMLGQLLTLIIPGFRQAALPSLLTPLVGSAVGISLIRLQFFEPLAQRAQLADAAHDLAECAVAHGGWATGLQHTVDWSAKLLHPDLVMLLTPTDAHLLRVVCSSGGLVTWTARQLQIGEGLAGRVFQTQQPMSIANYHEWDGRSLLFDDPPLYAGLSVPLVAGETALGVLSIFELKTGRVFTEQDRELLVSLAAQAAVCLRLAQLNEFESAHALEKS